MLKDDFFKILKLDADGYSVKAVLELNPDHDIFNGHFPGTPVVPGVCMMQMVKEIVEMKFVKGLMLSKAGSMKFLSVIDPRVDGVVKIDLSYTTTDSIIDVNASISAGDRVCFKFRGFFITTEEKPED